MAETQTPHDMLATLRWRSIGPPRGGRTVAVAGHPTEPMVFYFGACAGGVWKTADGGTYWENVSDGYFNTAAVGAIAVSESDPNVVYAGTGESCIRGNASHGDGVYRSTDGGDTWTHLGLSDTRHIARVRIHPKDPDLVYVAALGHAYGPNEQRGVFRSADGGATWERVLFKNSGAGAIDLSMDPNNPRVLYASIWQVLRQPWMFTSGGPDSDLFRSTDGGDTWTEITDRPGLPCGLKGRIGLAASPARTGRVWAIVEAEDRGVYRSDDGGETWEKTTDEAALHQRPWYYSHIFADPTDPETVYVLNLKAWKSTDGGRTFSEITMPHGDNHDLWIDPRDGRRMIEGNDGGACVSFNGGDTWSTIYNQPTSQFYHITTDNQFPYRVYATQQDNSAISVPSRSYKGGIVWQDAYTVGHSESGHIAVHPDDPNIVFSGAIGSAPGGGDTMLKYDHRSGQSQIVTIWPEPMQGLGAKEHRYRFQWTYPLFFSPHDSNVLYAAGNRVFRSRDGGMSWERVSPDLTRADESKMEPSGGPVTLDTSGVEIYGTIFSLEESPLVPGELWAGSDDGLVHVSRDDGWTWTNATPDGLPEWSLITAIRPSAHAPGTAYLSATRYRLHDNSPYLFKTTDGGSTWKCISGGMPEDQLSRIVVEDPIRPGLLYVGTETGVCFSSDDGASWRPLQGNLPVVPVHDLVVEDDELVAGTHGRSVWVLNGLSLLRQLADSDEDSGFHIFKPTDTYRASSWAETDREPVKGKIYGLPSGDPATYYEDRGPSGETRRRFLNAGANPPNGVVVSYYFKDNPEGEATLSFLDSSGQVVATFSSCKDEPGAKDGAPSVPADPGMNSFVWDMLYPASRAIEGEDPKENRIRPLAPPGTYRVHLTSSCGEAEQNFQLLKDPRVAATHDDLHEQFALLLKVRDKLSEAHDAVTSVRRIRAQVDEWVARAEAEDKRGDLAGAADTLLEKIATVEEELVQTKSRTMMDRLILPTRLETKLISLATVIAGADSAPTRQSYEVFDYLSVLVDAQLTALRDVIDTDLSSFAGLVEDLGIPPVTTKRAT